MRAAVGGVIGFYARFLSCCGSTDSKRPSWCRCSCRSVGRLRGRSGRTAGLAARACRDRGGGVGMRHAAKFRQTRIL